MGDSDGLTLIAVRTAAGLVLAMIVAFIAARPVDWYYPGSPPGLWIADIDNGVPVADQLRQYAAQLDTRITKNENTMKLGGRWLRASAIIAVTSLLSGGWCWYSHWAAAQSG